MNLLLKSAFGFYNFSWFVALPWLRLNHRLAEGFDQRTLRQLPVRGDSTSRTAGFRGTTLRAASKRQTKSSKLKGFPPTLPFQS